MAINGKHTTEVMIFPRVHRSARRCVWLRACVFVYVHERTPMSPVCVDRTGWHERVVSVYARAYHPIRTLALGLLNATSVQLPCNVRVSIHPSIYWVAATARGTGGEGGESGGSGEDKVGRCR